MSRSRGRDAHVCSTNRVGGGGEDFLPALSEQSREILNITEDDGTGSVEGLTRRSLYA